MYAFLKQLHLYHCFLSVLILPDLKTQQAIAVEDRLSKTKSLWMKTKKELDAARKTEGELNIAMASLGAQLESEKQQAETSKVDPVTHVHLTSLTSCRVSSYIG